MRLSVTGRGDDGLMTALRPLYTARPVWDHPEPIPGERRVDVGEWLRQQGLGRHEDAFRENAIDFDVLAELTDADLAGIGVPLGERKRLSKAIAALGPSGAPILPGEA